MDTSTEPAHEVAPDAQAPRRSRRRLIALAIATVATALLAVLAMAAVSALGVRRDLTAGRDALSRGKEAFVDGDAAAAGEAFSRAEEAFSAGAGGSRSIWLRVAGAVPFVGRTADAIRAVADAGVETARAATGLADAVTGLPGGLGALAPTADGIPLDPLSSLADAVARAERLTRHAVGTLQAAPGGLVLSPVASARADALVELRKVHRQLAAGALILRDLPSFLGADGPRRYFFGASNPAELRGTGGLLGAYAILTLDRGRPSFSDFRPVSTLPRLDVSQVPSPSQEYSTNFDFYRTGVGFWLNANMTPDFPLAARALWLSYEAATGQRLDGVIAADPFALKALMRVTDPVPVAGTGVRLTRRNVVPFTTNRAYALFRTDDERQLVLGRAARLVLESFLGNGGDDVARLEALLAAFDDGHVKVWSDLAGMQRGLALTSAGGAFRPGGTDAISVITNSASGTKLDYYQSRSVTYEIRLGPAGTATASLEADLANDSPTSGYPAYVIGPYKHYSTKPGENVAVVDLYCDRGCSLRRATRGGEPVRLDRYVQDGYSFFEDYVRTPSGGEATIVADLVLPSAWTGDETGGTYALSFIGQTTIRPTKLRVVILPPQGMRFTSASDGLEREGAALVYEGTPSGNLELQASFAPPLPVRVWRELVRTFT